MMLSFAKFALRNLAILSNFAKKKISCFKSKPTVLCLVSFVTILEHIWLAGHGLDTSGRYSGRQRGMGKGEGK